MIAFATPLEIGLHTHFSVCICDITNAIANANAQCERAVMGEMKGNLLHASKVTLDTIFCAILAIRQLINKILNIKF